MTEKTRVRLGAYFLFALLLLTLPVTLGVQRFDATRQTPQWKATATGMEYVNTGEREKAIAFVRDRYGLSRQGAQAYIHKQERKTNTRIGAPQKLPYGAQVDYYRVDGAKVPNTAEYEGTATVVNPASAAGQQYITYVQDQARKQNRRDWADTLQAMLKKNLLMIPLGMEQNNRSVGPTRKPGVSTKATTIPIRIAVICTVLPGFRDISPRSDLDTDPNDTGSLFIDYNTRVPSTTPTEVVYRQATPTPTGSPGLLYNYADTSNSPVGRDEPFATTFSDSGSIFDTPGGVFNTGAWGIPAGIPGGWDYTQEAMAPHATHATNLLLQDAYYDLFFDPAYSAVSTSNWFYQQTHGAYRIDGTQNDIVGWLRSAHQANRYPYQIGGGNSQFVFPGTPVIRSAMPGQLRPDPNADFTQNQIVRATVSERGLTILFSHPVSLGSTGSAVRLTVYTNSTVTTGVDGTATNYTTGTGGWVSIVTSSNSTQMDPYDSRRWTLRGPFSYQHYSGTVAAPTTNTVTWVPRTGDNWNLSYGVYTDVNGTVLTAPIVPLTGGAPALQSQTAAHNGVRQGCPDLQNTLIEPADLRITLYDHRALGAGAGFPPPFQTTDTSTIFDARPFARLKSMNYYTRSFVSGTYQVEHLSNEWGSGDDISGTSVRTTQPRVYPFETGPNDAWNGGYWPVAGAVRSGSAGDYSGDVNMVLQDNGISLTGYTYMVYIAADGGPTTPGGGESTAQGFQPSSSLNNINESGAGVVFHELSHAIFGAADLYDNDLYANGLSIPPPNPRYHECAAMGPYSVMDAGGRLDAWHQANWGFSPVVNITQDTLGVEIPEVEGLLRDPVVIKIPGNPYYIKQSTAPAAWQEYFLLENRNVNSSDGNGAYGFDSSTKGLYIYHIDGRSPARNNPNQAGFQREDDLLTVIIEQADGRHELEFNDKGVYGTTNTDPFGANTATRVTRFWQFPVLNGQLNDAGQPSILSFAGGSPTSASHGYTFAEKNGGTNVIIPGTETDSFVRIVKISSIGANMSADIYVEPAEIIATREALTTSLTRTITTATRAANIVTVNTSAAHGFRVGETVGITGTDDSSFQGNFEIDSAPTGTSFTYAQTGAGALANGGTAKTGEVRQGATNVEFMKLTLENPDGTGANVTDLSKMSTKDVYIDNLYVLESGSSNNPADVDLAKLYVDNNNNGRIDTGEPLLQSVALTSGGAYYDYALFTNLGYRLQLGDISNLILAYDIAPEAQINPRITVGSEFVTSRGIEPRLPGTVQERVRNDANPGANNAADPYNFGTARFPLVSNTAIIVGFPDRLVITSDTSGMPSQASQGQAELPMLKLNCAVNPNDVPRAGGSVRIDSIQVDEIGTVDGLADLVNCRLYLDNGDGTFDYSVDTLLATSSFTPAGPDQRANFPNLNMQIDSAIPAVLWMAVSIAPGADTTKDLQLSLKFAGAPGPPAPPQANSFVQLINNPTEADANRDFVEYQTPDTTWPINSLLVDIILPNNPPGAPQPPFSPSGGQQISDQTPTMSWGAATDPDPTDPPSSLHYEVQIADNAGFTTPTIGLTADGVTTFDVLADLTIDTDYWWRVRTIDSQDATSPWSPVQTFRVVTNRPPNQITTGFIPTGEITTRQPLVLWDATTDPDASDTPGTLSYKLQIDDNDDFTSPIVNTSWLPAAQTQFQVTLAHGLQWGTQYFWRVWARDVAGAEGAFSPTNIWFQPVQDEAPYIPGSRNAPNLPAPAASPFYPALDVEVSTANPVLQWTMPIPPDPDVTDTLPTIKYIVQLKKGVPSTHSDMTEVSPGETLYAQTTAVDERQWIVNPPSLEDDAHYFWWVRAVDDQGGKSDWSAVQSFWVNLQNDAPNRPNSGFDPSNGVQIGDSTPRINWNPASDPDFSDPPATLHYVVQFSTSNWGAVAQQYTSGTGQNWVDVTTALTDQTIWYYRVRTVDDEGAQSAWSVVQSFYLDVGNQLPTLSNPQVIPMYGDITTFYQLFVTYTDAENDPAVWVRCTFDNGVGPLDMTKVNPADNDATNGIQYVVGVAGNVLGLGAHGHAFSCQAGTRLPTIGFDLGPIIGTPSTTQFITSNGGNATQYQEGGDIWIRVSDADEDSDPGAPDTVQVTVTEQGGDSEVVLLTETGNATAVFRGSIGSLGRAGAINDGVLNVVAGAGGNIINAGYRDADDGANPAPDISSDTALVVDTVGPQAVNKLLTVMSGPHGRTALLDWTTYPEAAQADVAGYHVYYATAEFTSTVGLPSVGTVPAGTRTYTVNNLTPNTEYWFAVAAFDEVPNERTDTVSRRLTTRDTSPPTIGGQTPAPGATEVPLDTTISFTLDDPGVGVKQGSLVVTLTQNGQVIGHGPAVFAGDQYSLQVQVTPNQPLLWNATVDVAVSVEDFDGNQLLVSTWSFSTVTDTELPTLDEQTPAPNATNVPVTTNVLFSLHDSGSGIDQSAIQVLFDGNDVTADLTFANLPDGLRVTYNPPGDLAYSEQYSVSVSAADIAGNALGPVIWTFNTVVDASGVTVDQFDPARDAVDVPVDTNVSLRLTDPQAGIQRNTFRMWVQGQEVTNSADLTVMQTPDPPADPSTMLVSYNPPADLPYASDINVRVYVKDLVDNVTDLTYKFRTIDEPTFSISGEITDQDDNPLAGVEVSAGGRTATSDGTGGYRISGLIAGLYTVTASRSQYVFVPQDVQVTVPDGQGNDIVQDFVGTLQTYKLRGRVLEGDSGLGGVTVTCDGQSATTGADGRYEISGLPNGQYTVTPSLTNYHFQPANRAAQVNGANVNGINFDAIADTFTVAGTITDNVGNRVDGVQVECGGKVAITNAAGQYLISGLKADTYQVVATKAGYKIVDATDDTKASIEVTLPPSQTDVDFTANIEMISTFPAGVNFIGVPGAPSNPNPLAVFAGAMCYRWNPAAVPPRYLVAQNDPTVEAIQVKAGRGFFVNFDAATELHVAGVPTSPSANVSIGLSEGWNMIANPRAMPVKFNNFVPSIPDGIRPVAFVYDNATGSYKMVSGDASLGADRDSLLGWEGGWVRAVSGGVSLLVGASGVAAETVRPRQADLNGGWVVPIVARAGNRGDYTTMAGVVPGAGATYTVENPPTAPQTVDVYFTNAAGTRLAHDIRSELAAQTFEFVVACAVPDASVTVTLPDLSRVPADQQIMLVDKLTGKSIYARTMQAYSYRSDGASGERTFQLVISPRTVGALTVSTAAAQTRGDNVAVTYTVSKACSVSIQVMNLAGRCIRVLCADKPVTAGLQNELWNLSSAAGTRVPNGTYLMQIEAVAENGQRVRGMTQVRVGR